MEDIQLNSRVFLWPSDMESVLELATTRLSHRRDAVENALRARRLEFDETLSAHQKELDQFKKKDPPILSVEEMAECVETIEELVRKLKEDKKEAEVSGKFAMNLFFNFFQRVSMKRNNCLIGK